MKSAKMLLCLFLAIGCTSENLETGNDDDKENTEMTPPATDDSQKPEDDDSDEGSTAPGAIVPFTTASLNDEGLTYVWDESVIPEITIHMTSEEWNRLLKRYDEFSHNVDYFHADFTYRKGNEVITIEDGGVRLRGNTSRRRRAGTRCSQS